MLPSPASENQTVTPKSPAQSSVAPAPDSVAKIRPAQVPRKKEHVLLLTDGELRQILQNGMPKNPVCPKCLSHEEGKRHDKPHEGLEVVSTTRVKGGGMYGGGGTTTTYRCRICGATVTHSDDKLDAPSFWSVIPDNRIMDDNGFCERIFDRCCHEGTVMLNREELNKLFPGDARNALNNLQQLCESKGLNFTVDKERHTFTFELADP